MTPHLWPMFEPRLTPRMPTLMLKKDHTGERLYAARRFRPGDVVLSFDQIEWRPQRDRHTIEHPFGGHLFHPALAKVAHSCDPNCRISFGNRVLLAIRSIAATEPVTIDYLTTERAISHPFDCRCGSPRCRGRIG